MISYELGIRKDEYRLSVSILSRIDFIWTESSPFQDIVVRYFGNFGLLFLWTSLFKVSETFVKLLGGVTNCWFPRVQLKIQLDDQFFYLADPYINLFMNYKYRAKRHSEENVVAIILCGCHLQSFEREQFNTYHLLEEDQHILLYKFN
ncbi:Hypothetical_protein [Hexamita inflata]|uniref:Hypothetical_protein n=1 Tax=Hexamita inflata TaxID=28002 RepID=A0AA86QMG6_9EUKA|nr:Hypothetical protein HINF_LOCUS46121 [Hexamita inflata]